MVNHNYLEGQLGYNGIGNATDLDSLIGTIETVLSNGGVKELRFEMDLASRTYKFPVYYGFTLSRREPPRLDIWQRKASGSIDEIVVYVNTYLGGSQLFAVPPQQSSPIDPPEAMRIVRERENRHTLYIQNSPIREKPLFTVAREGFALLYLNQGRRIDPKRQNVTIRFEPLEIN